MCSITQTGRKITRLTGGQPESEPQPKPGCSKGRPFHRLIIRNIRDDYALRSRKQRLRNAGMLTLTEIAALLGVSTGTIKTWHHAGLIAGHPYNDKGQCLYPPPGPNPPARAQGRNSSERRPAPSR